MVNQLEQAKDFIQVWLRSETLDEVAAGMQKSRAAVNQQAMKYRKLGINLPRLVGHRGLGKNEISQLNSYIEKVRRDMSQ